jgi:multidrug resistance efflux pump
LAEAGTFVEAGDVVAQFESRELQDRVDDMLSNVVQAEARFDREKAKVLVERETLRQERDTAKAEYEKAAFDLRKTEVLSEIESQVLRNTAAQAEATWRQLDQEVALQEEVFRRRMRVEEIDIEDAKLRHERYARDLERMTLRAPVGGLVVLEPMYKGGGQFQQASLGDQVYPGTVFMQVVDLSGLLVQASINQVDAEAISVGMPATIRFDAYPDLAVEGHVSKVGAIATAGQGGFGASGGAGLYVKTIPVEVAFSTEDPRIIPDLSASVDVARAEPVQALVIPRSAVQEAGGEAFVRVRVGKSWERRPVEIGRQDAIETVVAAGLEPGEEIALRNPERP